jgi:opacity protein-like surface antigen
MKRLFLFSILLCGAFTTALAQSTPKIGVALETGLPVGDANDIYSVGLGGSAKVEIPVTEPFAVTVTAGYMNLQVKDERKPVLGDQREFVPVKAGAKYYFGKTLFGEGELGASIPIESGDNTAFAYAPGIGVTVPIASKTALDVGVRYEGWAKDGGNIDQVGLRAVIKF